MEVRNLQENPKKKKKILSMGRRKIEIKKIEKKRSLEVAFSKRRTGVFKKAAQLCVLSGANAAVIVFSPAGKPFLFGHPTADAVLRRFLDRDADTDSDIYPLSVVPAGQVMEEEKSTRFWLDAPIENMRLKELEKFKNSIEELREKAAVRVEEMAMMMVTEGENSAAGPSSSTTTTAEYVPPLLEYGPSSSVQNLGATDDDDSQTQTHTHADSQGFHLGFGFDFDFDFEFDEFFL